MNSSIGYTLTQYKEVEYEKYIIKLSILVLTNSKEYSIMMLVYSKLLDSYFIKQFNSEDSSIQFLKTKIGNKS